MIVNYLSKILHILNATFRLLDYAVFFLIGCKIYFSIELIAQCGLGFSVTWELSVGGCYLLLLGIYN